jgi:hypothetical protein
MEVVLKSTSGPSGFRYTYEYRIKPRGGGKPKKGKVTRNSVKTALQFIDDLAKRMGGVVDGEPKLIKKSKI